LIRSKAPKKTKAFLPAFPFLLMKKVQFSCQSLKAKNPGIFGENPAG